jgi:hypothetical protein
VDGIFTADPRKVPTARLIPIISPDEAAELTYYGSEVIHPFTMEQVRVERAFFASTGLWSLRVTLDANWTLYFGLGPKKKDTYPNQERREPTRGRDRNSS